MAKILTKKNTTKKEVILQQAASLFKTKSYSAASMRDLAVALGIEAPSLYNHIGSKRELLQVICFKVGNRFLDQIALIEKHENSNLAKIEAIIRFHIRMMIAHFDEVFVANQEWKHLDEPFLSDFLNIRRTYERTLLTLLEKGIAADEISHINPNVAVLTILSAVRGVEFWQRNNKNVSSQVLEDDMVKHLLTGIIQ